MDEALYHMDDRAAQHRPNMSQMYGQNLTALGMSKSAFGVLRIPKTKAVNHVTETCPDALAAAKR